MTKLLEKDPKKRLGANGVKEVKEHAFFGIVDWKKLKAKNVATYPLRRKPEYIERERKQQEEGEDLMKQNSLEMTVLSRRAKRVIKENEEAFDLIEQIEGPTKQGKQPKGIQNCVFIRESKN